MDTDKGAGLIPHWPGTDSFLLNTHQHMLHSSTAFRQNRVSVGEKYLAVLLSQRRCLLVSHTLVSTVMALDRRIAQVPVMAGWNTRTVTRELTDVRWHFTRVLWSMCGSCNLVSVSACDVTRSRWSTLYPCSNKSIGEVKQQLQTDHQRCQVFVLRLCT